MQDKRPRHQGEIKNNVRGLNSPLPAEISYGWLERAQEMRDERAGPPPNSLSPEVLCPGVLASALCVPTTRGHASLPHQPHTGPPE